MLLEVLPTEFEARQRSLCPHRSATESAFEEGLLAEKGARFILFDELLRAIRLRDKSSSPAGLEDVKVLSFFTMPDDVLANCETAQR